MKKYFITSDIHSYHNILQKELNKSGFDINNQDHFLILCGDAFDRGENPIGTYNFLKSLGDRLIYIRGNHEDLLFDLHKIYNQEEIPFYHFSNGTLNTYIEFREAKILDEVLDFINQKTIDYYELENYIFVHGWIPHINSENIKDLQYQENWRNGSKQDWEDSRWYNGMSAWSHGIREKDKTIFCGHWHTSWGHCYLNDNGSEWSKDAHFEPFEDLGIVALDACTAHSGKINIIVKEI